MTDTEIKYRFTILTWAVGATAALCIAVIGMVFSLSQTINSLAYQVGQMNGQLSLLINHVTLK